MERGREGKRERERAPYTIKPSIDMTVALSTTLFDTFFEPPNLTFPVSMLSIRIAIMLFTKLRTSQSYIPGEYAIYTNCQYAIYMLLRSFELPNLPLLPSMLSIRIASMLFTCCFEASNHPIFHSRPVCFLYVLPVCNLHAASKLRTTQSSIPSQYAIYTYCQYAVYLLLRSFEPPNLPFPASMLSICIASMPFTCCFEASNNPFPASMLSIRIAIMLFTCCFEASNLPILHSRRECYLYILPVCYLHAASKFRTWPVCYR